MDNSNEKDFIFLKACVIITSEIEIMKHVFCWMTMTQFVPYSKKRMTGNKVFLQRDLIQVDRELQISAFVDCTQTLECSLIVDSTNIRLIKAQASHCWGLWSHWNLYSFVDKTLGQEGEFHIIMLEGRVFAVCSLAHSRSRWLYS